MEPSERSEKVLCSGGYTNTKLINFYFKALGLPSGPGWENGHRILWPFSDLALLWLRTIKKHFRNCNYDSVEKFELAGVGINTIILLFRDKN